MEAGRADLRGPDRGAVDDGLDPEVQGRDDLYDPLHRKERRTPNVLLKIRPEDLDAGGMETVFPWRESDGDGATTESHEKISKIMMGVRNPVMLIRIKPNDRSKVVKRQGQESFNYGDLFAFTKVCSHLGCPASLYEQQTYRILCPCHQSQFDLLHFARPIFGPAARGVGAVADYD